MPTPLGVGSKRTCVRAERDTDSERPACFKIVPTVLRSGTTDMTCAAARDCSHAYAWYDLLFTMSDNTQASSPFGNKACGSIFHGRTKKADRPPSLSGLPSRSRGAAKAGGARRDRTDDLLLAKQALSQLSYGPYRISVRLR